MIGHSLLTLGKHPKLGKPPGFAKDHRNRSLVTRLRDCCCAHCCCSQAKVVARLMPQAISLRAVTATGNFPLVSRAAKCDSNGRSRGALAPCQLGRERGGKVRVEKPYILRCFVHSTFPSSFFRHKLPFINRGKTPPAEGDKKQASLTNCQLTVD